MIALRWYWSVFALWYIWWGSTPHLISTQMKDYKFELEKGIRYESGVLDSRSASTILECAGECTKEKSCCSFNFGSRQCELLSATAAGRTNESGCTHGYTYGYTGEHHTNQMATLLV